ncbi:hypothetical protein L1887_61377 [Cichorium endivia]|nr:hypothetical protein L1887_61377 [Cichorium endivia]
MPNNTLAAYVYYELGKDDRCFFMEDEKLLTLDRDKFVKEINDQKTNDLSLLKQPAFLSASRMRVTFKVYSSLKEFVNDFTVVGDLTFNEIEFVFRCYFSSLAVILGICLRDSEKALKNCLERCEDPG